MSSFIIVGAGVFGVSTAFHLATSNPSAKIFLVDHSESPYPPAASSDLNKIIRADYGDIFYMRLALEAIDHWNNDPLFKPYFHQTGMLFAENIGMGDASFSNYKMVGFDPQAEILTPQQARERFPCFKDANWTDVKDNYYNPRSGWGEADPAMRAFFQKALAAGVKYVQASVQTLILENHGLCVGIKTAEGHEMKADTILLCTGAGTAKLLADSAPHNNEMQVNGRMVAAAATSCVVRCDEEHSSLYRDAPVHFLGMPHTHGMCAVYHLSHASVANYIAGESIPLTADGKLKFNFEVSFTNLTYHEASGQTISVPPERPSQSTWSHDVPEQLKQSVGTVVKHVYGKNAPGLIIESYRMCWYEHHYIQCGMFR